MVVANMSNVRNRYRNITMRNPFILDDQCLTMPGPFVPLKTRVRADSFRNWTPDNFHAMYDRDSKESNGENHNGKEHNGDHPIDDNDNSKGMHVSPGEMTDTTTQTGGSGVECKDHVAERSDSVTDGGDDTAENEGITIRKILKVVEESVVKTMSTTSDE